MSNKHNEFILIFLQYVSIVTSGVLGILGLYFDFKNKSTGKLSKWGVVACLILVSSFALGIVSKTIELNIQDQKDASDAARARIASERTLKIAMNAERVANAISRVDMALDFSIPLRSGIFKDFQPAIHQKLGISNDDRDLELNEFHNLVPKIERWKNISEELTTGEVVVLVYPKGTKVPSCIVKPMNSVYDEERQEKDAIRFYIPVRTPYVSYPQQDERFGIEISYGPARWTGPSVLSLVDFEGATIVIYFRVPVMQKIYSKIKQEPGISYRQTAAMQYEDCSLGFYFNSGKGASIRELTRKLDPCSKYPYFTGKVSIR